MLCAAESCAVQIRVLARFLPSQAVSLASAMGRVQKRQGRRPSVVDVSFEIMTALILVCSLAAFPDLGACTRENALEVLRVPATFESPASCLMHGQAYLGQTSIRQSLNKTGGGK